MGKEEEDLKSVRQGYQAKSDEFGYQPKDTTTIEKGYQPKVVDAKPEAKNPPSGGSNVTPPKKN